MVELPSSLEPSGLLAVSAVESVDEHPEIQQMIHFKLSFW